MRAGSCFSVGDGTSIDPWKDPWIPWRQEKCIVCKEGANAGGIRRVADLFDAQNSRWKENILEELRDGQCVEDVRKLDLPSCTLEDKLCWIGNKSGKFTVKSCYWDTATVEGECEVWNHIWKASLHERIFLWRVVSDILPTNKLLFDRIGGGEAMCTLCGEAPESLGHLFLECNVSRAIAYACKWGLKLQSFGGMDMSTFISFILKDQGGSETTPTPLIFVSYLYVVWVQRNKIRFGGVLDVANAAKMVENWVEFSELEKRKEERLPKITKKANWNLPPEGVLAANVDAAWSGGVAAFAMVVRNCTGEIILLAGKFTGAVTAEAAEMGAINWAAAMAEERGWDKMTWRSDAKRVVGMVVDAGDQISWWHRKNILEIKKRFKNRNWFLEWIPRVSNVGAEAMAKWVMQCKQDWCFEGGSLFSIPPNLLAICDSEMSFDSSLL